MPNFWCILLQPSTAPGTVAVWMPADGMDQMSFFLRASILSAFGVHPLALIAVSLPVLAFQ